MEQIRVLQVFHGMDCGGAENMIMNLYRKMELKKVQFDFLVHTDKRCYFDDEIERMGGRIFHIPYYNVKNHFAYVKELNRLFLAHPEIQIVHGHLGSCAHLYLHVAKKYGCYTIAHSHNTKPEFSMKSVLYYLFSLRTRKVADYFMACGQAAGEYRFGRKITSNKEIFSVLNNAIDSQKFVFNNKTRELKRNEFGIKEDDILIGHVGRFNFQKNHNFILDIFNYAYKQNHHYKLMLVGDGELKNNIKNKVTELHLDSSVIFTGVRSDVADLLKGVDCFLFPSFYEGLPVTLIEAQAASNVCVVSDEITREVAVTDLVTFIPLNSSLDKWFEAIDSGYKSHPKKNMIKEIQQAGYDIYTTSKWLQEFYIVSVRRKRNE